MRIEFVGNDAVLFDGIPKNVIVQITFGNGEKITFPYSAEKTITEMFVDISKVTGSSMMVAPVDGFKISGPKPQPAINNNIIEREDSVLCVASEPREEGVDPDKIPIVGKEYRVIEIVKKNGVIQHYEVLDDASPTPIRMMMLPHEVILKHKHIVKQKVSNLSTIDKCDCGEDVALELEGETYNGKCGKCGCVISKARVKA